jgi:hypothetical protein
MPRFRGGRASQHNDGDPPGSVASQITHLNRLANAKRAERTGGGDTLKMSEATKKSSDAGKPAGKYGVGGTQRQRVNLEATKKEVE